MPHYDSFDICDAHHCYWSLWHAEAITKRDWAIYSHPSRKNKRLEAANVPLHRLNYRNPSVDGAPGKLTENGAEIYMALIHRYEDYRDYLEQHEEMERDFPNLPLLPRGERNERIHHD